MKNNVKIKFLNKSINESFARMAAAAFVSPLDPTINELAEIKTAISEAITNAIVHAYENCEGEILMECIMNGNQVKFIISDSGKGIENIDKAREALFTCSPDSERSGMGFTIMESFMDEITVESEPLHGTRVTMTKAIKSSKAEAYKHFDTPASLV